MPVKTPDQWFAEEGLERIDFLNIDAEGFDANVLEGASGLIESGRVGAVVFEYASGWIGNRRFRGDVAKLIDSSEYRLFQLFNGFLAPFDYDVSKETFKDRIYILLPRQSWATSLRIRPIAQID